MGEFDLVKICYWPSPHDAAFQSTVRVVFVTWLPLALVGVGIARWRVVHATMRGAAPLRLLARLAIAVQVAAVLIPLSIVTIFADAALRGLSLYEGFLAVVVGVSVLLPIAAISAAGIIAWHRVLVTLASREGEGRMLM
jgi:hypothetical protein